jgi:TolA-binding protein
MRTWYLQQDYLNTIESATTLLQHDKLTIDISEEAHYMIATSYYHLGDTAAARLAFEPMKLSNNGAYVGEAYYREAEAHYQRKDMKRAEQVIETIAASPVSDYWLAKSFILWADIYYSEGNRLQAKQTLQSIIENYDGEDLVAEATKKYEAIESEEKNEKEAQEKEIQEMKDKDNEINISTSTVK